MSRISLRVVAAGIAAGIVFSATPQDAEAQTFTACRVPDVGAIYMIGVAGAPPACLDASHVEFSWTEGGAVADGSITTVKLADGAVTAVKLDPGISLGLNPGDVGTVELADGAVTAVKIAANAVGPNELIPAAVSSAELADDAVTSAKIADGGVAGVDIAAGAVGTGQLATDAVDGNAIAPGAVGSTEILDGSVGAADLGEGTLVHFKGGPYGLSTLSGTAGSTTNLASVTVTAPFAGVVWIHSSGYCNTFQGASSQQIYLGWTTNATGDPGVIGSALILSTAGEPAGSRQVPYAASELFNVSSGTTTLYLNGVNSNGGSHSCAGTNVLMFAPALIS